MTPHIESKLEEIADTVIMPGDPLRAKLIAEKYLKNYKQVNTIRNMFAYTGYYKDKLVTIMGSGMGMPSIGIYSYELYKEYNVKNIIRIGTCGAYTKDLDLYDVILVNAAYSDSTYAKVQNNSDDTLIEASQALNLYIKNTSDELNKHLSIANIYSSDVFYKENDNYKEIYDKYGCLGVEMESFALFHNAKILNKRAACLLTVTDNFETNKKIDATDRQNSLTNMIEIALESTLNL